MNTNQTNNTFKRTQSTIYSDSELMHINIFEPYNVKGYILFIYSSIYIYRILYRPYISIVTISRNYYTELPILGKFGPV